MKAKICLFLLLMGITISAAQKSRSTSDATIAQTLQTILNKDVVYKNVQFDVDDRMITLVGTVELLSHKENLQYRAQRINGVSRVRNLITLDPPAVADEILHDRLRTRLAPWADRFQWSVHEGRVRLRGTATRQQCVRLVSLVWNIPGVREVRHYCRFVD